MKSPQQIVALGGGGFSIEKDSPLLDNYILGLTTKKRARVCFVGTASGDSQLYIARFYKAFPKTRAIASHLPLFSRDRKLDLRKHVLGQDAIYVGGGNTTNMLAVWRLHGLDRILKQAWRSGVILCGVSAGMNCWFESSVTDSFGKLAPLHDGLGLLPSSACPHYDGEADRRPTYRRLILNRRLPGGYAAEDGAALHFIDGKLHAAISSRSSAKTYFVERRGTKVVESVIPTQILEV